MKYKLINKAVQISRIAKYSLLALVLFILPGLASAQPTPPTGNGGTNGGIPDNPLSVPFDNHLSILLLAAGIILAMVVITRLKKNYVTKMIN